MSNSLPPAEEIATELGGTQIQLDGLIELLSVCAGYESGEELRGHVHVIGRALRLETEKLNQLIEDLKQQVRPQVV